MCTFWLFESVLSHEAQVCRGAFLSTYSAEAVTTYSQYMNESQGNFLKYYLIVNCFIYGSKCMTCCFVFIENCDIEDKFKQRREREQKRLQDYANDKDDECDPHEVEVLAMNEEQREGDVCVICMENPKDSVFTPCGHQCICHTCGDRFKREARHLVCPICKERIKDIVRVWKLPLIELPKANIEMRRQAEEEEEKLHQARELAEAEEAARKAEQERIEAEQAEQERIRLEEERRIEAERIAKEERCRKKAKVERNPNSESKNMGLILD